MIGNDIVDLEFSKKNSRWQEQRFLDKLFTSDEKEFIYSDAMQFHNIWRLWSMKESAYKAVSQTEIRFNPKEFKCSISNSNKGEVVFGTRPISTFTEMHPKFIQTTAFIDCSWLSNKFQLYKCDAASQHSEMHQHALKTYSDLKKISKNSIEIRKNSIGKPQFFVNGILQIEELSLTHHGHYGALAISYL